MHSQAIETNTLALDCINQTGSKYTNEQRLRAVSMYITLGNLRKTAIACNMPQKTLVDWTHTEWWEKLLTHVQEQKKDEFNANFTRIIESCTQTIETKLENDEVSARDAAMIMGITFDKRQVLNNQATSITKSLNINDMHEQFQRFMDAKQIESDVIERD